MRGYVSLNEAAKIVGCTAATLKKILPKFSVEFHEMPTETAMIYAVGKKSLLAECDDIRKAIAEIKRQRGLQALAMAHAKSAAAAPKGENADIVAAITGRLPKVKRADLLAIQALVESVSA